MRARAGLVLCSLLARCALLACALQQADQQQVIHAADSAGQRGVQHTLEAGVQEATGGGAASSGAAAVPGWLAGGLQYEHKTMKDLVVGAGYPLDENFVTTADGYVLGLYRIPHGASAQQGGGAAGGSSGSASRGGTGSSSTTSTTTGGTTRPPVLLQHGLLDSSAAWVLNDPSQSLGFILADAGYDVWLGNSRGNAFSRNHTGLDPAKSAFWDFSWDDMAAYDLPAVVAYILDRSGASQLAYIGHSQGTTQMFAALSSATVLRSQLSVAVMLAPAVHMRYIQALPMQFLAALEADKLFELLGAFEFLPSRAATADMFGALCQRTPLACASVITAICGFNPDNMNLTRLATAVQYAPSGTSVKNMAHWAQAIRKSRVRQRPLFQWYDYGDACFTPDGSLPHTCNMRVYHSIEPPSYDLGSIDTPLAILYGAQDKLADPADVATLLSALPATSIVYTQLEQSYEHLDFTWGIDAKDRIYPAVLQLLHQYHQGAAPRAA